MDRLLNEGGNEIEEDNTSDDRPPDLGTIENETIIREPREIRVYDLFRYSNFFDRCLMFFGTIFAICNGSSYPVLGIIFGEMTNVFIDVTKRGFKNESVIVNGTSMCPIHNSTIYFIDSEEDDRITQAEFLSYMGICSLYYLLIAIAAYISCFLQTFLYEYACERQIYRMRKIYFLQVLRQEISWFELNTEGSLSTKLSDDIERIREGMGSKVAIVIQYYSTFVTGVAIGFYADWRLSAIFMLGFPFIFWAGRYSAKQAASSGQRELLKYAAASEVATEVLGSIKTVAAFSEESKEHKRYAIALYEGRNLAIKRYISYAFSMCCVNSINYFLYGIGFFFGCLFIDWNHSTPGGVFTVFFSLMMGAFTLGNMVPHYTTIMTAVGAARTVFKIIDRIPRIDPYSNVGLTVQNFKGHILFDEVTFRYPTRVEVKALSKLSLEITPGSKVAIVGHSGAGKSSIVNLLMRFYDITAGEILFDGKDIRDLNLKWLRSQIGLVSQEPVLFGVSIRDNISHGRENVTLEEVVEAAKLANAHSFISKLTEGYDTLIGERGSKLSGGQKQRIAIARAVVRQPKILLLDEATSSLDYRSEKAVQKALANVMRGRTTIIIAHRLSTINNVDKIYVLKDGCVVESGNHEELMELKTHYYDLVMAQQTQEKDESIINVEPRVLSEPSTSADAGGDAGGDDDIVVEEATIEIENGHNYIFEEKNESIGLRLLNMQKKECHLLILGLTMCCLAGSVNPFFAFLYGEIFSTFTMEGDEMDQNRNFWTVIFILFGIAAGVSYGLWSFAMAAAAEFLIARVRDKAMKNVMIQEISWFDYCNCSTGVIITRLARDAPIVKHVAGLRVGQILSSLAGLVSAMGIAFFYGWKLALALLLLVPLLLAASYKQVSITRTNIFRDLKLLDKAGKVATECVQNLKTVQALGRENDFVEEYMDLLWVPYRQSKKNAVRYGVVFSLAFSTLYFMYAVAFKVGSYFIGIGEMTPSDVYRVFFALSFTSLAVGQSAAYLTDYAKGAASSKMVLDLMDKRSRANPLVTTGSKPEVKGKISFRNIKFSYPTRKAMVILDNFNLEINPGETVAIVGESGCGKSTILSLLERFYFPDAGEIMLDDTEISRYNLQYFRRQIGLVTQEPVLFNCSIIDNIRYGAYNNDEEEVSYGEVVEAAEMANAHDFILELPQGYSTVCGDKGSQLSGGQKQRIAIARALVRKPKILLLDEATSALDSENERIVQEALDKARGGRTCIVIAHRLSTIENADRIAVLDKGKIVELGTHKDLIAKRGHYYNLYNGKELVE